jgi:flagellar hook-length control protein FliK
MSPTAPQPIPIAPSGREPIPSPTGGAPPGAPPEGPPFQSALETEWARTAIAEGQQSHSQNPSPANGEQASTAEAFDRLRRGSTQPARRHSGHQTTSASADSKASASSVPSTATPTGSNPTLAAALPDSTPTDAPVPGATAGRDVNQGIAAHLPTQPGAAPARAGALSAGEEGMPNSATTTAGGGSSSATTKGALTVAEAAHDDALPSSPSSPADGALAMAQDGTPTAGAPSTPQNGTPAASGNASALAAALKDARVARDGVQAHSTPAAAPAGDLATPHSSPATPANRGARDLAKTLSSSIPSTSANADGVGGETGGLLENSASPLLAAALDGDPAVSSGEVGSAAYGVGLQEAIESLHGTIQLAARQGLSQARISLQPEELGEIRINLTQTAQGLLARVSAESPAAAQALAAAHAQLRQALSSLGVNLTRLDIGHHDPSAQSGSTGPKGNGQGGAARGEGSSGSRPGRSTAIAAPTGHETDSPATEEPAPPTSASSAGALIDVFA